MASVHDLRYRAIRTVLKKVRKDAELTQVQLSQALEVGQSFVSKIERGEAFVDLLFFIKWCQVCQRIPEEVLAEIIEKL
jgi:transcriptional regulator with XRE-family HTH domain